MNCRHVGVFVLITACSYFAQTFYWIVRSTRFNSAVLSNVSESSNILRIYSFSNLSILLEVAFFILIGIGPLAIRFFGAINAVSAFYVIWRNGTTSISSVRGRIANALFCEGLYWSLFIPTIAFVFANFTNLSSITSQFLVLSYSLQILLIAPFLIALSLKFRGKAFDLDAIARSRLVWTAYITYVAALWANYTLRWSEVVVYRGLNGLLIESTYVGLFNSAITLLLALIFAIAASAPILKKRGGPVLKWLGLSLTFLGLHFLIHIVYTAYTGFLVNAVMYRLKLMMMSDVWPVAVLGLGLYIYLNRRGQVRAHNVKNQELP